MAESVKVITRCRPLNDREKGLNSKICVEMDTGRGQVTLVHDEGPPKEFTFDGSYYMDSTGEQIYNDIIYPLVESVVSGYNGTVFAYGQTGAGKTFSMQGLADVPVQRGIIPRAFEHIFVSTSVTADEKFLVHCSYLEIYNEEVRDLLGADRNQKLEVKENPDRGVYVAGLSMHHCHDVKACNDLMQLGFNNRHVGATLMNKDSSRSHSIFTVYVECINEKDGKIRTGKLNLVDLAGSERQSKTGATGDRFKEATKINLSLSALGNVISALVDGKSKHIPYRDSKLTRLLQDSLGGNTKTIMLACISPSDNNYDETLSTLRYANRAKNIKNKPKINEDPKDALLREYQEEIERLKAMIGSGGVAPMPASFNVDEERQKLREEFEEAMNELRNEHQREQLSKAQLQDELVQLKSQFERANADLDSLGKLDPKEAAQKLQQLQGQFIGGEQANNEQLKQKRMKKLKEAQTKTEKLAAALNVHKDDPLLQVYSSTQEKLDAVLKELKKEQNKVRALESEIEDLQGEFELDRLDYLDTIRKQDQQLKLYGQILDKLGPIIKKDCNYHNIEKIKKDSVWSEDEGRWILPELSTSRTVLPNANNGYSGKHQDALVRPPHDDDHLDTSNLRRLKVRSMVASQWMTKRIAHGPEQLIFSGCWRGEVYKILQDCSWSNVYNNRLLKSEEENTWGNYFKPTLKPTNVAAKYSNQRRLSDVRSYFPKRAIDNLVNGVVYTDDIYNKPKANQPLRPTRLDAIHR